MAIEIVVPRLGWSMDEGIFGQWLKQEGQMVEEGDLLYELESDKATQEVESFDAGILRLPSDAPQPGDTVTVGQCLGYLCAADEAAPAACGPSEVSPALEAQPQPVESTNPPPATPSARRLARQLGVDLRQAAPPDSQTTITPEDLLPSVQQSNGHGSRQPAAQTTVSPRAAARAAQLGVPLADVTGTGRGGRIRERDVVEAATSSVQETPAPPDHRTSSDRNLEAKSPVRRKIAERMVQATQETAPVTLFAKADATELSKLCRQFKAARQTMEAATPTLTAMLLKLLATAIQQHVSIQRQWIDEGLLLPDGVHIAVAVQTDRGLLTPVVRDVPHLPLGELSSRLDSLLKKARVGQLAAEEMQGGTFTLSNLGQYSIEGFTPILNPPQSAILGIGRIQPEPVAQQGEIVIREQVHLSLTFDHRIHDGAEAAAFLQTVADLIRIPNP